MDSKLGILSQDYECDLYVSVTYMQRYTVSTITNIHTVYRIMYAADQSLNWWSFLGVPKNPKKFLLLLWYFICDSELI